MGMSDGASADIVEVSACHVAPGADAGSRGRILSCNPHAHSLTLNALDGASAGTAEAPGADAGGGLRSDVSQTCQALAGQGGVHNANAPHSMAPARSGASGLPPRPRDSKRSERECISPL